MDLLKGNVRQIYFRYLGAAFGSALISSIYGLVDSAMVGQYQGPEGTAALAIVAPVWNIIYSLGLLTGIGRLGSAKRGAGRGQAERRQRVFYRRAGGHRVLCRRELARHRIFRRAAAAPVRRAGTRCCRWRSNICSPSNSWCRCSCSTRCWRRSCATTARRGLPRRRCWRAASSMCSAITFLCSPVTWAYSARGWQQPSARGITFTVMLSHFFSRRCTPRPVRFRNAGTKLRRF